MPRKTVFASVLVLTLVLTLGACAAPTPEAATEIPTAAAPTETTSLPDAMLDVEWQLHSVLESEPAAHSAIPQPENYTIQFDTDGNAAIRADCNNVGATYTVSGSSLALEMGPTTLASCGEDSGDQLYIAALGDVRSYAMSEFGVALDLSGAAQLQYIEAEDVIDLSDKPGGVNVTADVNLQVRTGPGAQFRISHWATAGDQGEVIGQSPDDEWWVVAFPDDHPLYDRGWVSKSSTTVSNPNNEEIPVDIPPLLSPTIYLAPPDPGQPQGEVVGRAAIMTGPGNAYQMWGLASDGPTVVITGKSDIGFQDIWWQIELPTTYAEDGRGWVDQIYLSTIFADLVQVVFDPPPPPDLEARPTAAGGSQAAIRFSDATAVRAGPGSNYDDYLEAEVGWVMGIIGESSDGDWWVVSLPTSTASDGYGWVLKDSGVCSMCDVPSPYVPVYRNP